MQMGNQQIRSGYSLPQFFYTSDEAFRQDSDTLARTQWLLIDHVSAIPNPGDFVVHEVLGESIILVRDNQGAVQAWYNVCRHRGSRICLEKSGKAKMLVCPYHAWSFNLDGTVLAAPGMPKGFDKKQFPLRPCHLGVTNGLIFLNMAEGDPPSFDAFSGRLSPFLERFGIGTARIAHRQRYRAAANWKLVAENNLECYHCRPSHKSLVGANPGMLGEPNAPYLKWKEGMEAQGAWIDMVVDFADSDYMQFATLFNLGKGAVSSSMDGKPVAPLMEGIAEYSESSAFLLFNPISGMGAFSDYAFMMRFAPVSPTETDYEISWLVHADAKEGVDYEIDRLRALWDVTTEEDKMLAVNNQLGVHSRAYEPGPYSIAENRTAEFIQWYERLFVAPLQPA